MQSRRTAAVVAVFVIIVFSSWLVWRGSGSLTPSNDSVSSTPRWNASSERAAVARGEEGATASGEHEFARATMSPHVEVRQFTADGSVDTAVADLPSACSPAAIRAILVTLVERLNARDVDGVLALMQPDSGDVELDPEIGEVAFVSFGLDDRIATTHSSLRSYLPTWFDNDTRISLTKAYIGPSRDLSKPGGPYSLRNADIVVELEQQTALGAPQALSGKGSVDCISQRLVMLNLGPGALGF